MDSSGNQECPALAALMQPLFCKLCETRLNSPFQATAHYVGKNHLKKVKIFLTKVPADKVFDAKMFGLYCKLCNLAFNSEVQAQQHYKGRNHQRKLQGEPALPKGFYNATTNKWTRTPSGMDSETAIENLTGGEQEHGIKCTTCNCSVTSQVQLEMHKAGAKHCAKVAMLEKHKMTVTVSAAITEPLMKTPSIPEQLMKPFDMFTGFANPLSDVMISHAEPEQEYLSVPAKKCRMSTKDNFSMYRTPSGMLYCAKCNVNMNSETQFVQHFSSKRHTNRGSNKRYGKEKGFKRKFSGANLQSD